MCSDGMAQIQREGCDPRQHLALSDQYPVWRCQLAEWLVGVAWRSGLAECLGGVAWRSGLAECLGGTSRACFSPNQCSAIDSTRGVRATRNWQLAFVALCFAARLFPSAELLQNLSHGILPTQSGADAPPPREISHPEPQCTPRFPGAASAARGHPGVSRIAPRAICASRSQFSCREPLRPPEVHVASWCGNNLTTPAVPQTCSPQLRHANSPSRTPLKP
jgi:hypothetical protein